MSNKKKEKHIDITKRTQEIFQEVQKSLSNHRKNVVSLRRVQETSLRQNEEDIFYESIYKCINKTLTIKKKDLVADRVMAFLFHFLSYSQERDNKKESVLEESFNSTFSRNENTLTTKFSDKMLIYYLKGIEAKDKTVRFRIVQIIAIVINHLGTLEESYYLELREKLLQRAQDKETNVRVQIAIALSQLQDEEDPSEPDTLVTQLIEMMQKDPSAEVRRATLSNIVINSRTLPSILERCKDVDLTTRKTLYEKTLVELGDFQPLSIEQREMLLKLGLEDREKEIRDACIDLVTKVWLPTIDSNLIELLEKLDVMNSEVAEMTLKSIFESHPNVFRDFKLPENFWESLSIEGAFLAKVSISYASSINDHEKLDILLPSAIKVALLLKEYSELTITQQETESKDYYDFVLIQLLNITNFLDFADEAGRRKIFSVIRQLFVKLEANDTQFKIMVDIVKKLSLDELDFVRTMVEIITDIQQTLNESAQELTLKDIEEQLNDEDLEDNEKEDHFTYLNTIHKSILSLKFVLQLCELGFDKNPVWSGLLNDFISPTAKCNIDTLHEVGSECLALCCMLDKDMASSNFSLFIHNSKNKLEDNYELRIASLKTVFDLCILYGVEPSPFNVPTSNILIFFKYCLKESDQEFLSISVVGICKLYLTNKLGDLEILARMIQLYFIPFTQDNLKLRQSLNYFLEVYSKSNINNQNVMAKVFIIALTKLIEIYKKFSIKFDMVTPIQIAQQLADWTDPRKIMNDNPTNSTPNDIHLKIAISLVKMAYEKQDYERKIAIQVLNKLAYETMTDKIQLNILNYLLDRFKEVIGFQDLISRNAFVKFHEKISKQISSLDDSTVNDDHPELVEIRKFVNSFDKNYMSPKKPSRSVSPVELSVDKRRKVDSVFLELSKNEDMSD